MPPVTPNHAILSEQSILIIVAFLSILLLVAGILLTIIFRKDPQAIQVFRGGHALHHVTVMAVVFATILLGLQRVLNGEAVASLLGGIIGYVLGSLKEDSNLRLKNIGRTPVDEK